MSESIPRNCSHESLPGYGVDVEECISLEVSTNPDVSAPMGAHFRYRAHDPYAVEVVFIASDGAKPWTFARELLIDGVFEPAGVGGDIAVWPSLNSRGEATVMISLYSQKAAQGFTAMAATKDVLIFLDRTTDLVPKDHEYLMYENLNFESFSGQ